jgi:anionic cell wall polymer biosynthesis LytR-Cps2A-Psr (LCP) family protein
LGKKFPYYVVMDFKGMERLVDALGGVPIKVKQAMKYTDNAGGLHIDIRPGQQTLSGSKAIQFVRYRADGRGDVGRITRQQQFLAAWGDALMKEPTRLLALRDGLPKGVTTNMRLPESLRLVAKLAVARCQVNFATLPGRADYINKVSYWIPDAS